MKKSQIYGIFLAIGMATMFVLSGCGGCGDCGSCNEDDDFTGAEAVCYYCGACNGCVSGCLSEGCGCQDPYYGFMIHGVGYIENYDAMVELCAE